MGEFYVYTAVFRAREDIKSVAHLHPHHANIMAAAGKSIVPITRDGCLFHEGVPIYEGFPLYMGNQKMGDDVVSQLGNKRAILHKAQGAFVVGKDIEEALFTSLTLEKAARSQIYASILGTPTPIPEEMMIERE